MKKWSLLVAICVLSSLATPLMSRTQQYETYLEALEGSVLCRQGLIGYGGELLEYWGWLTDPNGSLVAQDYKQTWSWRLDGQYTHEPSISGTYMCHADFYASGAQVASRQAPVQIYTKPTGETTASGGWSNETIHLFNQTLTGSGSFVDRWVTEEDPGGGGPDYCYYPGSPVPEFIAISTPGYLWRVGSGNTWGPDAVGWPSGSVQHYRSAGRARGCPGSC
jgi:hypothetical protein